MYFSIQQHNEKKICKFIIVSYIPAINASLYCCSVVSTFGLRYSFPLGRFFFLFSQLLLLKSIESMCERSEIAENRTKDRFVIQYDQYKIHVYRTQNVCIFIWIRHDIYICTVFHCTFTIHMLELEKGIVHLGQVKEEKKKNTSKNEEHFVRSKLNSTSIFIQIFVSNCIAFVSMNCTFFF